MSYWPPYVSVAKRHANAKKQMNRLQKKGKNIQPIEKTGRIIAKSFWGKAWCDHLETFSDYDNRLPRGRTYVRNGSVCHLEIKKGRVDAMVSGSEIYKIKIIIKPLPQNLWQNIRKKCAGGVSSMLELLQGKLSESVMQTVTNGKAGLFPLAEDIDLDCDCPDWATMCKHVTAALYGIGARLDHSPELLFLLRDVDHKELISSQVKIPSSSRQKPQLSGDLSDIFGINLEHSNLEAPRSKPSVKPQSHHQPKNRSTIKAATSKPRRKINISRGVTAYHVKKLQKELALTDPELAQLLGKNIATVRNWKKIKGKLNLQQNSLQVLKENIYKLNNKG